jgi:electron transport complex protein RnfB
VSAATAAARPAPPSRGGRFTVTGDCVGCGACLLTCPVHAIRPAPAGAPAPLVVLDHCTGCAECGEVCPADACVPAGAPPPEDAGGPPVVAR